ncbi:MAG: ice-binding family protein [Rhodoferax sp.]|nr:ice-binding family protein [Rhodoferax sp.]
MKNIKAHTRLTPWLMAATFSVALAACGGGGQSPILGAGDIAPVVAPVVTVVTPFTGSTVAPNTKVITAAFSKPMDAATLTNTSFTLTCLGGTVTTGPVSYLADSKIATLPLTANLPNATDCTATVTMAAKDSTGVSLASNHVWQFSTSASTDVTAPTVTLVNPADLATGVATNTAVKATFSEAMDPLTLKTTNFTLFQGVNPVAGTVSINPLNTIATFTPNANLAVNTVYTATVVSGVTGVTDQASNPLAIDKVWTFTTAAAATTQPLIALNLAEPFGTFGGTAGMTNMGTLTVINGDIGTTATGTSMVTGFHESLAFGDDIYTETTLNKGTVNGMIYTCTNSIIGANSAGPSAPECAVATQARLDAETAYLALVAKPVGGASPAPGANLAGITLQPGVYKAPAGSFLIEGGDLTLDAQGDANATWVFQMATTLTVGGPGTAAPQSIILAGGALAKNVFWQVGSTATINAAGGGTMVGTIIAQAGVKISTADNMNIMTLNGRALSLGASVTMVNTVVNVPAQ